MLLNVDIHADLPGSTPCLFKGKEIRIRLLALMWMATIPHAPAELKPPVTPLVVWQHLHSVSN